jgi:hypothetical protein
MSEIDFRHMPNDGDANKSFEGAQQECEPGDDPGYRISPVTYFSEASTSCVEPLRPM